MIEKLLSIYEAAGYLRISPSVLSKFTQYCPKYGDSRKLQVARKENGLEYFAESELKDYNKYLLESWPIPPSQKRAEIPDYLVLAIKQESEMHCAFCSWVQTLEIAHIEPWSSNKNNHPHNLIAACPNHHSQYDFGYLVRLTPSITSDDVKRIKKENLKLLQARQHLANIPATDKLEKRLEEIENSQEKKLKALEDHFRVVLEERIKEVTANSVGNSLSSAEKVEKEITKKTKIENSDREALATAGNQYYSDFEPENWRKDELTNFISEAYLNVKKTFANEEALGKRIIDLAELTFFVIKNLRHSDTPENAFANLFFMRSHSLLLSSIRLGMSGQFPEAHAMLKGALVHALQGIHVSGEAENILIFLRQDTSAQNAARMKSSFRRHNLFESLRKKSQKVEKYAQALLSLAESWGEPGKAFELFGNVVFHSDEEWSVMTMGNSDKHYVFCLKQIARTQVCFLLMVQTIYPERFKLLDVDRRLIQLMTGL